MSNFFKDFFENEGFDFGSNFSEDFELFGDSESTGSGSPRENYTYAEEAFEHIQENVRSIEKEMDSLWNLVKEELYVDQAMTAKKIYDLSVNLATAAAELSFVAEDHYEITLYTDD